MKEFFFWLATLVGIGLGLFICGLLGLVLFYLYRALIGAMQPDVK